MSASFSELLKTKLNGKSHDIVVVFFGFTSKYSTGFRCLPLPDVVPFDINKNYRIQLSNCCNVTIFSYEFYRSLITFFLQIEALENVSVLIISPQYFIVSNLTSVTVQVFELSKTIHILTIVTLSTL
jgi:hypothetical protein